MRFVSRLFLRELVLFSPPRVLICQELGGHFVRHEAIDDAAINAVKECAEAIAAISDGKISELDVREIREAISALSSLIMSFHNPGSDARG